MIDVVNMANMGESRRMPALRAVKKTAGLALLKKPACMASMVYFPRFLMHSRRLHRALVPGDAHLTG